MKSRIGFMDQSANKIDRKERLEEKYLKEFNEILELNIDIQKRVFDESEIFYTNIEKEYYKSENTMRKLNLEEIKKRAKKFGISYIFDKICKIMQYFSPNQVDSNTIPSSSSSSLGSFSSSSSSSLDSSLFIFNNYSHSTPNFFYQKIYHKSVSLYQSIIQQPFFDHLDVR